MKILITGVCGFVGSCIARYWLSAHSDAEIYGIDNLARNGSETNRQDLIDRGVRLIHGDVRMRSDLESIGPVDWVIDGSALPSVLAGVGESYSSRQSVEHNLLGTLNLLEFCHQHRSGFVLLSTSRVYSIDPLTRLPLDVDDEGFVVAADRLDGSITGISPRGISESFATSAPVSLYGATKLASETMALEYGLAFDFPVWINRCGVIGGAGQFGRSDQGIFTYWVHSHRRRRPLRYLGFGGSGHQVRDCLHPQDLARLIDRQITTGGSDQPSRVNVSGGTASAMSLKQLTRWCDDRFGVHPVQPSDQIRKFDLPWVVLDSSLAESVWGWQPEIPVASILDEIADHAEHHPNWLELSR
ncbi:CDP-paratose 2-epimerase [Rubripirellula lacrimiformis]|uniref:CDP-paratose 2-epimerase n=1 Tax=Rubripirellula lacrimiformis TaxID=1930273 RepID=A0A517N3E8_9BACT|nr:NAD-dependent epimerase/dehydratase family protein [Rubripirellula lacrimiformis]QDT01662.1 CDP-paratose 2-epimerase [Rubripirellula lacrimiformis]